MAFMILRQGSEDVQVRQHQLTLTTPRVCSETTTAQAPQKPLPERSQTRS